MARVFCVFLSFIVCVQLGVCQFDPRQFALPLEAGGPIIYYGSFEQYTVQFLDPRLPLEAEQQTLFSGTSKQYTIQFLGLFRPREYQQQSPLAVLPNLVRDTISGILQQHQGFTKDHPDESPGNQGQEKQEQIKQDNQDLLTEQDNQDIFVGQDNQDQLERQSNEGVTTVTNVTLAPGSKNSPPTKDEFVELPEPPVCGISNATLGRVVGGEDAKLGDFPWMALLGYKLAGGTKWLCGGSLVSSRHVLTAAHCIHNQEKALHLVRLGELDLARDDDGATPVDVPIKRQIEHEQYNAKAQVNDVAVLVLDRDVEYTKLIKPICIPKNRELRSQNFERYNPIIAGWGNTKFRGTSATHLQVLQLPVVTNEMCANAYRQYKAQKIDERVLCAGFTKGGKDACQGDSGGPLMQPIHNAETMTTPFYQIGVVSYGKDCAKAGFPGVYSRVTHFTPWIVEKITGTGETRR